MITYLFDQFMNRYPISSERLVNREVTVSPQLEVGRESSGVALEELCLLSLHHRMEVTVKAKLAIWKHTYALTIVKSVRGIMRLIVARSKNETSKNLRAL